jgi:hypothetical protein
MKALRQLSPRPELLVDDSGFHVDSPVDNSVGRAAPFGRERVVAALPLNDSNTGTGPVQLAPAVVFKDAAGFYLADPAGNLLGQENAVWVHRMLYARWTQDTRRLT